MTTPGGISAPPDHDRALTVLEALAALGGSVGSSSVERWWARLAASSDSVPDSPPALTRALASAGALTVVFWGLVTVAAAGTLFAFGVHPLLAAPGGVIWALIIVRGVRHVLMDAVVEGDTTMPAVALALRALLNGLVACLPLVLLALIPGSLVSELGAYAPMITLLAEMVAVLIVTVAVTPLPSIMNNAEMDRRHCVGGPLALWLPPGSALASVAADRRHRSSSMSIAVLGGMRGDVAILWPSLGRSFRLKVGMWITASGLGGVAVALAASGTAPGFGPLAAVLGLGWGLACFVLQRHRIIDAEAAVGLAGRRGSALISAWTAVLLASVTAVCLLIGVLVRNDILGTHLRESTAGMAGAFELVSQSEPLLWVSTCVWGLCLLCFALPLMPLPSLAQARDIYEERLRLVDSTVAGEA